MTGVDYYQILNVQPDCSYDELRKAFRRMSLETHPDRFQGEGRIKAEKEYQFIVKAFNTLKDTVQRKKYDEKLNEGKSTSGSPQVLESRKKEAVQYEKAGFAHFKKGSYSTAVEFLNNAAFLAPSANVFYHKGLAEMYVAGKKKDALESLHKAIELDPYRVIFRLALIEALVTLNMKTRATKVLEEALGLFPTDDQLLILKEKLIDETEEKTGLKGLFSVFRGKS